jgi:hypothetical protein
LGTGRPQDFSGFTDRALDGPRRRHHAIVVHHRNPELSKFNLVEIGKRNGGNRIDTVAAINDAEAKGEIVDRARHRADLTDHRALTDRYAAASKVRTAAGRGTQRRYPAKRRGNSHTAADIGSQAIRRSASGQNSPFSATRAATRPLQIPGVVGAPIHGIVALGVNEQLRHIGLCDDDCACGAQACDIGIVGGSAR